MEVCVEVVCEVDESGRGKEPVKEEETLVLLMVEATEEEEGRVEGEAANEVFS